MEKSPISFAMIPPLSDVARLMPMLVGGFILIWSFVIFMLGRDISIYDDGMIYLRYAYNLANGYGLVYNPGEYYESNTNFLWSILLTPAFWFGFDPSTYLRFLGVAIGAGVLWMAYKLTEKLEGTIAALLVVMLLGGHYSFYIILNSGFAPHLVTLLALAAIYWCFKMEKSPTFANGAAVAALMTLLLLTRLDASLIFGVVWLLAMFAAKPHKKPRYAAAIGTAPLVVFGLYLLWKYLYYGNIFPASYYAKAGPNVPDHYDFTTRGLKYLWIFFREYWFIALVPFFIGGIWRRLSSYTFFSMESMARVTCIAVVLIWCAYMVKVGGGFYDFRFMATIVPFLFMAIISALWFDKLVALAGAVVLLMGAANYTTSFHGINEGSLVIEKGFSPPPNAINQWKNIGISLGRIFSEFDEYHPSVKIAVTAGGYLPFYSKRYTLEMQGWADSRVSLPENHVGQSSPYPGHNWTASPGFMAAQGINLVFGYPQGNIVLRTESNEDLFHADRISGHLGGITMASGAHGYPTNAQFVRLPIDGERDIIALYLIRNPELDEFFARKGYYVHNVF